jgi:hypothetical protein
MVIMQLKAGLLNTKPQHLREAARGVLSNKNSAAIIVGNTSTRDIKKQDCILIQDNRGQIFEFTGNKAIKYLCMFITRDPEIMLEQSITDLKRGCWADGSSEGYSNAVILNRISSMKTMRGFYHITYNKCPSLIDELVELGYLDFVFETWPEYGAVTKNKEVLEKMKPILRVKTEAK